MYALRGLQGLRVVRQASPRGRRRSHAPLPHNNISTTAIMTHPTSRPHRRLPSKTLIDIEQREIFKGVDSDLSLPPSNRETLPIAMFTQREKVEQTSSSNHARAPGQASRRMDKEIERDDL